MVRRTSRPHVASALGKTATRTQGQHRDTGSVTVDTWVCKGPATEELPVVHLPGIILFSPHHDCKPGNQGLT